MVGASKIREWYVVEMSGKVLVKVVSHRLLKMFSSLKASFPFTACLIPLSGEQHPPGHCHLSESGSNSQDEHSSDDRDQVSS
jgi:hypothetical protein